MRCLLASTNDNVRTTITPVARFFVELNRSVGLGDSNQVSCEKQHITDRTMTSARSHFWYSITEVDKPLTYRSIVNQLSFLLLCRHLAQNKNKTHTRVELGVKKRWNRRKIYFWREGERDTKQTPKRFTFFHVEFLFIVLILKCFYSKQEKGKQLKKITFHWGSWTDKMLDWTVIIVM